MSYNTSMRLGFTLIELSIVLVIIALVSGSILLGRDLIAAAGIRAQVAQVEKYHTSVNTFKGKYGHLPGDIPDPYASQFGFTAARGNWAGAGDGNGVIESSNASSPPVGALEALGETTVFWRDLSDAKLIDGAFTLASETAGWATNITVATSPGIGDYFPRAKIGQGNFLYVWSGGRTTTDATNYFGLSALNTIAGGGAAFSDPALTVLQAQGIDSKIDDGMPQSGRVVALYVNDYTGSRMMWASGGGQYVQGATTDWNTGGPTNAATPYDANNCYDNNNTAGPQRYSTARNGNVMNCALSFKFQ